MKHSEDVIHTRAVSKFYGNLAAVAEVSLRVKAGEIYGFLGLNGAGKTTLIRMLLGMIKADAGELYLFGARLTADFKAWNEVGYLVETPHAYPNLTVEENLQVYSYLRRLDSAEHITQVISELKLERYRRVKAKNLSLGNRQRLGLAKAIMHRPRLLILDEPINGLDPAGIAEVRELLRDMAARGTTIFLSSHILEEISRLTDRVGIIHQGKLIDEFTSKQLQERRHRFLQIRTNDNARALGILRQSGFSMLSHEGAEIVVADKGALDHPAGVAALLVENKLELEKLYSEREDLEHYFLRVIKSKSR